MTLDEAVTIINMIDGHWNQRMNEETHDLWLSILLPKAQRNRPCRRPYGAEDALRTEDRRLPRGHGVSRSQGATCHSAACANGHAILGEVSAGSTGRRRLAPLRRADPRHGRTGRDVPRGLRLPSEPLTDEKVWVQIGEYGYEGCAYDFAAPTNVNGYARCTRTSPLDSR